MLVNPFAYSGAPFYIVFFLILGMSIGIAISLKNHKKIQIIFIMFSMLVMTWYIFSQKGF